MKAAIIIFVILFVFGLIFLIVFSALVVGSHADDQMESYFDNPENFNKDGSIRFTKTPEEYYRGKS